MIFSDRFHERQSNAPARGRQRTSSSAKVLEYPIVLFLRNRITFIMHAQHQSTPRLVDHDPHNIAVAILDGVVD